MSDITELKGITDNTEEYYYEEGLETVEDIADADVPTLLNVKYVGEGRAQEMILKAQKYIEDEKEGDEEKARTIPANSQNTTAYDPTTGSHQTASVSQWECTECGNVYMDRAVARACYTSH